MSQKTVSSVSINSDSREDINDNFTELYTATSATTGLTATVGELNVLDNAVANVTLVATPAVGTCDVQFTFKDALGNPTGTPTAGRGSRTDRVYAA